MPLLTSTTTALTNLKKISYICAECNHPLNIIKQIPRTMEKRLSQLSSNEEIFNESAPFYEDKLHQYTNKN